MNRPAWLLLPAVIAGSIGCSEPAQAPVHETPPPQAAAPEPAPNPVSAPAPAPASPDAPAPVAAPQPEPAPQVPLPEGLPAIVHIYPGLKITEATVIDAATNQFQIKGETDSRVNRVLDYYIKYFPENGWEEDMIMEQPGNTVISFKKDGILQYVESKEGGPGSLVTITIGSF